MKHVADLVEACKAADRLLCRVIQAWLFHIRAARVLQQHHSVSEIAPSRRAGRT